MRVVLPVFDRLGDLKFLVGCEGVETQNNNESLHHVCWGMAPKEQFTFQAEAKLEVTLGVLIFNEGIEKTMKELKQEAGLPNEPPMAEAWEKIDSRRF